MTEEAFVSVQRSSFRLLASAAARVVLIGVAAAALAGCVRRTGDIQAQIPDDYRERHPIVLGDVPKVIDVFLVGNGGIDHRQAEDLRQFMAAYRKNGKGSLIASLPPSAPGTSVHQTLGEIRRIAAAEGIPGGHVQVDTRGPTFPTAAAIRLHYSQLEAKLVSKCGQWPHDLAGGSTLQSWENRPYYNLGCSYQSHLAAQIADPRDLIRTRPEGDIDVGRRIADIESVRDNEDPTTKWPQDQTKINQALQ